MNNEIYKEQIHEIRQNRKLIAVPGVRYPSILRVYGCVFCSVPLLSVYLCVRMPHSLRSIALRDCLRARRFWATLLLHTTCARSCCTWCDSCVAA